MKASLTFNGKSSQETFVRKVGAELNRAERYRVFLSLTVLDLGPARTQAGDEATKVLGDLLDRVQEAIRACDHVELLADNCLAVLLPETKRQDAQIVASRLADLVDGRFAESTGKKIEKVIPVEIASYPDTAGAKTMAGFLEELAAKSRN